MEIISPYNLLLIAFGAGGVVSGFGLSAITIKSLVDSNKSISKSQIETTLKIAHLETRFDKLEKLLMDYVLTEKRNEK